MTTLRTIRIGVAMSLILAGIATGARGQAGGGGAGVLGGEMRGLLKIKAKLICAECDLDQMRGSGLRRRKLFQLNHRDGQVIIEVQWTSEPQRWANQLSRRIVVRAADSVFQKLTAEENMFKEVELTTLLRKSMTLDLFEVTIRGQSTGGQKKERAFPSTEGQKKERAFPFPWRW